MCACVFSPRRTALRWKSEESGGWINTFDTFSILGFKSFAKLCSISSSDRYVTNFVFKFKTTNEKLDLLQVTPSWCLSIRTSTWCEWVILLATPNPTRWLRIHTANWLIQTNRQCVLLQYLDKSRSHAEQWNRTECFHWFCIIHWCFEALPSVW